MKKTNRKIIVPVTAGDLHCGWCHLLNLGTAIRLMDNGEHQEKQQWFCSAFTQEVDPANRLDCCKENEVKE